MKHSIVTVICMSLLVGCGRHEAQEHPTITGIGVQLGVRDHTLQIMGVLPDTPAAKAGLHSGLIIQQIDGTNIVGKPLVECVAMTRGLVGSKVQLEVVDLAKKETNLVEFTREKITLPAGASSTTGRP
jgi:carboxyl-terminal processing protease